jgi:hypothetical protein
MTFSVDPLDVLLPVLRDGLPGVTVFSREPDNLPSFVPLVVLRRTGGGSENPDLLDIPFMSVECWAAADADLDAARKAHLLADDVRRVLWTAWRAQTVTAAGWINRVRETSAPEEVPDLLVPQLGRYQATYEIRIRKAR